MWRAVALVVLCAYVAGCTEAPGSAGPSDASPPAPFQTAGSLWLPEQSGPEPARAVVEFVVNASGFEIVADVRIAASLGVADAPATVSSVSMILLGPDEAELARASHAAGPPSAHELRATAPAPGTYQLVFDCELTGGGAGTGDYAEFEISAAAPPA